VQVHDWADASLLLFHEPIRLDLLEMDHVMSPEYFDGLLGWKIEIFFKWYKAYFHPLVSTQPSAFRSISLVPSEPALIGWNSVAYEQFKLTQNRILV
jgi:hypothetical protein